MYRKISILALSLVMAGMLFSSPTYARDNDRHDNRRDWHDSRGDKWDKRNNSYQPRHDDRRHYKIKLEQNDYRTLNRRMETAYWQKCATSPHGRYYDCSPSRNNYRYTVGRPLPRHITVWDVPQNVRYTLPRPYANTRYVWVDRDILLIDQRDNTILDIITAVLR